MAGPWFYRSAATGTGDGLSWANARTTLTTMTSVVAGDTIWVADDHAETAIGNLAITFPGTPTNPNIVICADHNVASPGTGDWKTTGVISGCTTTNTTTLDLNGSFYCYGLTFRCGLGNAGASTAIRCQATGSASLQVYENCLLQISNTNNSGTCAVNIGTVVSNLNSRIIFQNTSVSLSGSLQKLQGGNSIFEWRNTTALPFQGTIPTNAFLFSGPMTMICEGLDFNAFSTTNPLVGTMTGSCALYINNCRFNQTPVVATNTLLASQTVYANGSGTNAAAAWRSDRYSTEGNEVLDAAFRTGGASDGTRSFCRRLSTRSATSTGWTFPYTGIPIVKWNATTAANVSITVFGCCTLASMPTNDQIWLEFSWLGNASYPISSFGTTTKANLQATGTALTADTTSTWDTTRTRANNTLYLVGDVIKVASNPGKVFICTVGGGGFSSAGSEPAGYATATDGTSIVDNQCTFVCGYRFSITYTISSPQPQLVGPIYITPKVASPGAILHVLLDPEV